MTKPTPIEEWIEKSFKFIPDAKWGAQQTAHHILEELGVLECLEYYGNRMGSGGKARELLTKLKGEKDE